MAFPETALDIRVQLKLFGQWVDMGPVASIVDDFYTDEYLDEYLGRIVWDVRRLPEQEISITHGAQDETSAPSPASVSLELWNNDGYLTPLDPRSPWWSPDGDGWGLNCELRILIDGIVEFHGEVSDIIPSWPFGDLSTDSDPGYAVVNVTASGILRRVGQGRRSLKSPLRLVITQPRNLPHVTDYWPMEDGADASFFASGLTSTGVRPFPMSFRGFTPAADDSILGSEPVATVQAGGEGVAAAAVRGASSLSSRFAVQTMLVCPMAPADGQEWFRAINLRTSGTVGWWQVEVGWSGATYLQVRCLADDGTLLGTSVFSGVPPGLFGAPVELRLNLVQSGGSVNWSLVWSPISDGTDPVYGYNGVQAGTMGVPTQVGHEVAYAPAGGVSFGHTVIHDGIAGGWLVAGDSGWLGETALARIRKLCDQQSIPLSWSKADATGDVPGSQSGETAQMGRQRALGLGDLLEECRVSDGMILCEQRDGLGLHARTRRSLYNADPVLELDAGESEIANPFTPQVDDQNPRTAVTVNRIEGTSVDVVDPVLSLPPEEGGIGFYEERFDLSLWKDGHVRHHATWRLHLAEPTGARYSQVTIDLGVAPHLIPTWQTVRVGDRIRVVNLPPQHSVWPETVDLRVEGWTETLSSGSWVVTLNCSPFQPYVIGRWEESRWGLPSTLYAAVDESATSIVVTYPETTYTFAGGSFTPKWSTDAGDLPLDFLVGKCERVTATAIGGVTSSGGFRRQTFTVTRDVNGLGRAHPAGSEIRLFEPAVLGL